jgi:PAS domain S-box-containing protein
MDTPIRHPAFRLALHYVGLAGAWIILSDRALEVFTTDPLLLTRLQTAKGWAFVVCTGLFLYLFGRREFAKIEQRDALVRSTEASLRLRGAALHAAANAIAIADAAGRVVWVNTAFTHLTGYAAEEAIGRPLHDQGATGQAAAFDRTLQEIALSGCPWHGEITASRKDGTQYTEEQTVTPVRDDTGAISYLIAIKQDVTARHQAEAALAAERNLLRTLIDNLPDYIFIKDPQSRFVMVNCAQANLLGVRSPDEAVGRTDHDYFPDALAAQYRADEERVIRTGVPLLNHEERGPSQTSDEPEWHLTTKVPLRDGRGDVIGTVGISRNITQLKRTEDALIGRTRQLEAIRAVSAEITRELDPTRLLDLIMQRAAELVGALSGTLYLWDAETQTLVSRSWLSPGLAKGTRVRRLGEGVAGTVAARREGMIVNDYRASSFATPETLRRAGVTAVIGEPLLYRERLAGVIALDNEGSGKRFTREDGEVLALFATQAAIAVENARLFGELNRSYANLQLAQEELVRAEKLRALGQMAAGIAHDLNNTLAAVLGQVELLQSLTTDPELLDSLDILEVAATDGAQVVRRLQGFARQQPAGALAPCDLAHAVAEALEITRPHWRDDAQRQGRPIEITTALDGLPPILGRVSEIREALTNLILNAVDAMPEGGALRFAGRVIEASHDPSVELPLDNGAASAPLPHRSPTQRPDQATQLVELTVTDTGVGMTDDVRRQAFEPFFTTKGGRGTGLGLAMVYGIMERHGGGIDAASTPGNGTTFRLRFQTVPEHLPPAPARAPDRRPSRRVLVIDDDPRVRSTLVSLLRAAGHQITEAGGGREGLARFTEDSADLVLTDLSMPEVNGWDVAAAVKARVPTCPVILLTGWADHHTDETAGPGAVDRVLHKPVRLQELLQVIAELTPVRRGSGDPERDSAGPPGRG